MTGEEIARAALAEWEELKERIDQREREDEPPTASEIVEELELVLIRMENRLEEAGRPGPPAAP